MNTLPIQNRCPKCAAPLPDDAPQGLCPKCLLAAASAPTETGVGAAGRGHAPPSLANVQAAFPQFEILELVGAGGMGAVFKARQPKLDRFVALKLLSEPLAADAAFAERFNREARVLARLSHPGIVAVYDFGQAGGFFFLLMEFVDGVNLRQAMQAGRFTPTQALGVVPKICEALQFAHEEGILHRDIKPENILLDTKGRVKIADFGIAKLVGEPRPVTKLTATGAAIGTPNYMAPEQLEHPEDVDQRADIYSLGVVFYEMLTGELPIGRFAAPSEKSPVDPRVDAVVFRTLEKERERRYGSAGEVKTSVENLTAAPPAATASPFNPAKDFVLCPPKLPRMAKAIIVYALTVAPVLWLLGLFALEPLSHNPLVGFTQILVNSLVAVGEFVSVILLLVAGFKLRALRHSAATWLMVALWLRLGGALMGMGGQIWVEELVSELTPGTWMRPLGLRDGVLLSMGLAALVFEICALVWLHRHRLALRSICETPPPPPSPAAPLPAEGPKQSASPAAYWQQAWLSRPARTRFAVKAGIIALAGMLAYLFACYRIDWVHEGRYLVRNSQVGWPTPWLSWWRSPLRNSVLDYGFDFFTFSFAAGLGAIALGVLFARLRATERRWPAASMKKAGVSTPPIVSAGPRWSKKSIIGAALAGLSLPLPVFVGIALALRMGSIGGAEILILLGVIMVLAVPGTILGWMGLVDIRASAGQLRGLPLAVFAALAWPLGLLVGGVLVVPAITTFQVSSTSSPPLLPRLLVLLIPAGVLTFTVWAVYATARWGANQPTSSRPRVLKWIFLALLLALASLIILAGSILPKLSGGDQVRVTRTASRPFPSKDFSRVQTSVSAIDVEALAPPRENFIVTAIVLSNGVPVSGRELRAKLWPANTRATSPYVVRWQRSAESAAVPWEVVVEEQSTGRIAARLRPQDLPRLDWSATPSAEQSAALKVTHEARAIETARALQAVGGGNAGAADWSVRVQLQSQPPQPTESRRGLEADFVLPANQVSVFEVVTRSNGVVVPVPDLAAHVINGTPEPWQGKFIWADDPEDLDSMTALPRWSFGIVGSDGRLLETGPGVPLPPKDYSGWLTMWTELKPDEDRIEGLSATDSGRPAYGLRVRTQAVQPKPGLRYQGSGFGTNWMEAAASRLVPSAK